jgi:hypothetical protein
MWLVHINGAPAAGSQSIDGRNKFACIEQIAGINPLLQFKRIGSKCQFLRSANSRKPIAAANHRKGFQRNMQKNYQDMNVNGLSAISYLQQEPHGYG